MLDLGKFFDKAQAFQGSDGASEEGLDQLLDNTGLNPDLLEDFSADELGTALENIGLDPSNLSAGQLAEIVQ